MNKIQKRIHQLTKVSIYLCKKAEFQFIPYREQRKAWRKELKRYNKSELIQKPIEELYSETIYDVLSTLIVKYPKS